MSGTEWSEAQCWQAVQSRDRAGDGVFVYAVQTTGVYCRPSCASRQPRRENVRFFALPAAAEAQGFRPCKRCRPQQATPHDPQAVLAQAVCAHIDAHLDQPEQLTLAALAAHFCYAPRHLTTVFGRVLGITPHQYAEARRMQALRSSLQHAGSVAEAVYAAGFSSLSRAYERSGQLGMTPGQYQQGARDVRIGWATTETAFGVLLLAATPRGLCAAGLYADEAQALAALRDEVPQAVLERDDSLLPLAEALKAHVASGAPAPDVPLDVQATTFQARVWAALRAIPRGHTRSYRQVADEIGQPTAVRAVASACGSNRLALLIPCHRVIGSDGGLHGYRWGVERKALLLQSEMAPENTQGEPVARPARQ